jgi:hypothetical protein
VGGRVVVGEPRLVRAGAAEDEGAAVGVGVVGLGDLHRVIPLLRRQRCRLVQKVAEKIVVRGVLAVNTLPLPEEFVDVAAPATDALPCCSCM